jgi:hypothetical protein
MASRASEGHIHTYIMIDGNPEIAYLNSGKKGKAIPVTGHRGPQDCETSRIPYFLDNRLRVMSTLSAGRPSFNPRKIPGPHFCYRLSRPQGHSAAGRISSIKKSSDYIGNRTRDLPACSIVPQLTTLPRTVRIQRG